jgi:hypothetical protein
MINPNSNPNPNPNPYPYPYPYRELINHIPAVTFYSQEQSYGIDTNTAQKCWVIGGIQRWIPTTQILLKGDYIDCSLL